MRLSQSRVAFFSSDPALGEWSGWIRRAPPEAEVASPPAVALGAAGTLRWTIPRPHNVHNVSRASSAEGGMDDAGPFFEAFRVGTEMRSRVGRPVTETDNVWFTLLTGNGNQIHFNEDYTRRTFPGEPFLGRRVVNGFLTVAIAAGLLVGTTSREGVPGGLGGVRLSPPGFPGGTVYSQAPGTEGRETRGPPRVGRGPVRRRGRSVVGRGPPPRGDPRPRRQRPALSRTILPFVPRVAVRLRGDAAQVPSGPGPGQAADAELRPDGAGRGIRPRADRDRRGTTGRRLSDPGPQGLHLPRRAERPHGARRTHGAPRGRPEADGGPEPLPRRPPGSEGDRAHPDSHDVQQPDV